MDRISATIIMREINASSDSLPRVSMFDVKNASIVSISEQGGLTVYAVTKELETLLMRIQDSEHTARKLIDFKWVKW